MRIALPNARAAWALASVITIAASSWPITDSVALHVLQHIALITLLPPLLLRAEPRLALGAALTIERGVVLVIVGVLLVYLAHVPVLFDADLTAVAARLPLHGLLVVAGLLLVVPISGTRSVAGLAAVALVAVAELGLGALGMWLAWVPDLVYRLPDDGVPRFGLAPGSDQSLAGAFILVLAEPLLAVELVILLFRVLDDEDDGD